MALGQATTTQLDTACNFKSGIRSRLLQHQESEVHRKKISPMDPDGGPYVVEVTDRNDRLMKEILPTVTATMATPKSTLTPISNK